MNSLTEIPDSTFSAIDSLNYQPDQVAYLDSLVEQNHEVLLDTLNVFNSHTPDEIYEQYGPEALAWTAANTRDPVISANLIEALEKLENIDNDLFKKAKELVTSKHQYPKGTFTLLQYRVMERVMGIQLDESELGEMLLACSLPNVNLSDKRIADYSILPMRVRKHNGFSYGAAKDWSERKINDTLYNVWLDTPAGFALTYRSKPVAVASVAASDSSELMIHQLQGVKPYKLDPEGEPKDLSELKRRPTPGLAPLDWRKLMIEVSQVIAKDAGMSSIAIESGENNEWANRIPAGATDTILSADKAHQNYNLPAERLGFKKELDGNWHKALGS